MSELILMNAMDIKALVFDAVREALTQQKQLEREQSSPYLTCKQAAAYLGKTPNALRQMVSKEQIKYIKKEALLYFRSEDLVEYLEGGTIKDDGSIIKMNGGRNA